MELNKHFDYTDNYSEIVHTTRLISAEELTDRFFCAPQWITALMKFRNAIVKPFGLKGEKNLSDFVIDRLYLSVCTKVRYNNRMGKFYFTIIKPFHRLICKILLKRVRRNL